MIKLKVNIDYINSLYVLCVSIIQSINESLRDNKKIEDQAKFKSELYEINCVKDKLEIQRIKMRNNSWARKKIVFKLSPTQSYLLVKYWSRNIEPINNYNMVVVSDLANDIYKQITNM